MQINYDRVPSMLSNNIRCEILHAIFLNDNSEDDRILIPSALFLLNKVGLPTSGKPTPVYLILVNTSLRYLQGRRRQEIIQFIVDGARLYGEFDNPDMLPLAVLFSKDQTPSKVGAGEIWHTKGGVDGS